MNKTRTLTAAALGTVLLVSGCGSSSSPAVASTSASASAAAGVGSSVEASSAPPSATSAASPSSSAAATEPATTSDAVTSSAPVLPTSAVATSSVADTSESATATAGDASGGLDATSTAWVSQFCTVATPFEKTLETISAVPPATGAAAIAAQNKKDATELKGVADALVSGANSLAGLPAPTFAGGANFAIKSEGALKQIGGLMAGVATKLSTATTSSALEDAFESLSTQTTGPLADIQKITLTPATDKAISNVPSCKAAGFEFN